MSFRTDIRVLRGDAPAAACPDCSWDLTAEETVVDRDRGHTLPGVIVQYTSGPPNLPGRYIDRDGHIAADGWIVLNDDAPEEGAAFYWVACGACVRDLHDIDTLTVVVADRRPGMRAEAPPPARDVNAAVRRQMQAESEERMASPPAPIPDADLATATIPPTQLAPATLELRRVGRDGERSAPLHSCPYCLHALTGAHGLIVLHVGRAGERLTTEQGIAVDGSVGGAPGREIVWVQCGHCRSNLLDHDSVEARSDHPIALRTAEQFAAEFHPTDDIDSLVEGSGVPSGTPGHVWRRSLYVIQRPGSPRYLARYGGDEYGHDGLDEACHWLYRHALLHDHVRHPDNPNGLAAELAGRDRAARADLRRAAAGLVHDRPPRHALDLSGDRPLLFEDVPEPPPPDPPPPPPKPPRAATAYTVVRMPTYWGESAQCDTTGQSDNFREPLVPVLLQHQGGLTIVPGADDPNDLDKPDLYLERRPGGWMLQITPPGGGDPAGRLAILDDGRLFIDIERDEYNRRLINVMRHDEYPPTELEVPYVPAPEVASE